jgi:hypothetical protein
VLRTAISRALLGFGDDGRAVAMLRIVKTIGKNDSFILITEECGCDGTTMD